jgi:hypothetical protein
MEPPHDKNSEELREHFDHNGHGDIEQGLTSKKGRTKSQPDQPASSDGVQKACVSHFTANTCRCRQFQAISRASSRSVHPKWNLLDS